MVTTNFNKTLGDFDIAWPERVSRHDLVYKAPPTDPMQYGMPIGNGDIGAILWCDDQKLYLALNKSDLWDDGPEGVFEIGGHEENATTLRHGCRIIIDFGTPIFDSFYLTDFNGRLHLKNGCIEFSLSGPFGSLSAKFFICYDSNILCGKIDTDFIEQDEVKISLERYGSRTFSRWYAQVKRDASIGLCGTEASTDGENLYITHALTTGEFVCALKPIGNGFTCSRKNSHTSTACGNAKSFLFFATVTSPFDSKHDKTAANEAIALAEKTGFNELLCQNEKCWKAFWEKSFIETDDDYLDNLWHLVMYYSCSGQRGRYPGRFINSLWNWNRDVQPWTNYFHWNQQQAYWGLNAAGHHELCEPYLNYRFSCYDIAKENAKSIYNVDNALFISDVANRLGYNTNGGTERNNHTPVGEIALDFWRQYQYTCDLDFLKQKALPFMVGASRFIASCFIKEDDGKYHAKGGSAYEGWEVFYDVITDLAMLRSLLNATLKALEITGETDKDLSVWKDMLKNVVEFPIIPADPRILKDNGDGTYTILLGKFKGRIINSNTIFALGKYDGRSRIESTEPIVYKDYVNKYVPHFAKNNAPSTDEPLSSVNLLRGGLREHRIPSNSKEELIRTFSGHPQACIAPMFPMHAIGIKDKDTPVYNAAVTTALTIRNENFAGFDPIPLALARLGITDAVDEYIYEFPSMWQYYNNGFGHYGPNPVFVPDANMPFRLDTAKDADTKEPMLFEAFRFRHMGLEPHGVFSATMNERLLQSYDGVIRIAPAYNKGTAKFKLHAVGGFVVMAQIDGGELQFVAIKSLHGNTLKLENPWSKAYLDGKAFEDEIIALETKPDEVYLFTKTADTEFNFTKETPKENTEPKVHTDGITTLGTLRSF